MRFSVILSVFAIIVSTTSCRFHVADNPVLFDGSYPLFYIKRNVKMLGNPVDSVNMPPSFSLEQGSDLYMKNVAIPGAPEVNISGILTLGKGAVMHPEASYDGSRVVFTLRCTPESASACRGDETWNLWEYNVNSGQLHRVIQDSYVANLGNDIDPVFLPDGDLVFVSDRQAGKAPQFTNKWLDEDFKAPVLNLHRMNEFGERIEQISFGRSHERHPSLMLNGRVVFSRWENFAQRNQIIVYSVNPDGTDLNVEYGAHSPGEAFMYPRQLDDGRLISAVMPLQGTWQGGALMVLNVNRYADVDDPVPGAAKGRGQESASWQQVPVDRSVARQGRFGFPFPLRDGSNEVLVSYSAFHPAEEAVTVNAEDLWNQEAPPRYGIYRLNIATKAMTPIVLAQGNTVVTHPIAAIPRRLPARNFGASRVSTSQLPPGKWGILHVRSVYDTDVNQYMGPAVLTASERGRTPITGKAVTDTNSNRIWIPDLQAMKVASPDQLPARFIRITRAVQSPVGLTQLDVGESDFSMQELVGYAPIEPDGSVRVYVPADESLGITVLDKEGRAFQAHTSWLQVREGEEQECDGCHDPKKEAALNTGLRAGEAYSLRMNSGFIQNASALQGETMAQLRTRVDPAAMMLQKDILFQDVWTDTLGGIDAQPISKTYAGIPANELPQNGMIDYVRQIQPIWNRSCVSCHNGVVSDNNPNGLNLSNGIGANARANSYNHLLLPTPVGGPTDPLRQIEPRVAPGFARGSYLMEVLYGEEMFSDMPLTGMTVDHTSLLQAGELRLINEWIDLGAQFFNYPFDEQGNVRSSRVTLNQIRFNNTIFFILRDRCMQCHYPIASDGSIKKWYRPNRFVLTGNQEGDFLVTVSMVTDINTPANSLLLSWPSHTSPLSTHPYSAGTTEPVLPPGSREYNDILQWIQAGGP